MRILSTETVSKIGEEVLLKFTWHVLRVVGFFSLALLINILVEIRKQHYQMIALFAWLYWI